MRHALRSPASSLPALALLALLTVGAAPLAHGAGEADERAAPDRAGLEIPDAVWEQVLERVDRPGGRIGYTDEDMSIYGADQHVLRSVRNLFRDARRVPRETGRWTDGLLRHAPDIQDVVYRAFRCCDVAAGRGVEAPKEPASLEILGPQAVGAETLPPAALRLVVDLLAARRAARPWLALAFRDHPTQGESHEAWYRLASAPWQDEDESTPTLVAASLRALEATDRAYLAYAAAVYLTQVRQALATWRAAPDEAKALAPEFSGLRLRTTEGLVWVTGEGNDLVHLPPKTVLSIDLGGDDHWSGNVGTGTQGDGWIAAHVDLGGNDTYEAKERGQIACGLFGIGVLIDESGDDVYTVEESGLGCAWHGVGLLLDRAGNDVYRTKGAWGQGVAHVGVGALVDLEGDDLYECGHLSQGLGSTLGTGLLLDVTGNDRYVARDDGNVSALYLDQSVAMSQGCGYGRRSDFGDGHSLAGGVGILLDGAGDDHYHAQVWAQGCGYWWGLGVLEDRAGHDTYENGKYAAGAAAHFAIGVCVDLDGNDRHNQGVTTTKNQFQAHARDGSIGVFFDGGGNDAYLLRDLCGGAADLCSIGLFWDRDGDDHYVYAPPGGGRATGDAGTGPLGTASRYPRFRSARDEIPSWGVFLDTGGTDRYETRGEAEGATFLAADGTAWTHQGLPRARGVGLDLARPLEK